MNALALTQVEGWTLATSGFDDGEPRVRDLELAEHLGYERPRGIRDLITRLVREQKLSDSDVRRTVRRTRIGVTERDVEEFWLTEAQALKVVAKSETARADAILDELIRVFVAVRRGEILNSARFADMATRIERIESMIANGASGCIGPANSSWIKTTVRELAKSMVRRKEAKSEHSARRRIYNALGALVGWGGPARPWIALPAYKFGDVRAVLIQLVRDADDRASAAQLTLLPGGKGDHAQ